MLRAHQKEFLEACREIKTEERLRKIAASVTPGGGKSALPVIAAHELIPYVADHLAWITPRTNLRIQGESSFNDGWLRHILGHKHEIRARVNQPDLLKGLIGYVTTYQAISFSYAAARSGGYSPHEELFNRRRMILILDEPQHIALDDALQEALQPLVNKAAVLILMSGGFSRHDNKRIAFLDYLGRDKDGRYLVNLNDSAEQVVIKYSLSDATREHAIIKINFELRDCAAGWDIVEEDGSISSEGSISSFDNATYHDTAKGLYAALQTEFSESLLIDTVEFWRDRRKHNPRSLLLVVCPSIGRAQDAMQLLQRMRINVDIATSDDSPAAHENIERFRQKQQPYLDALVTVAMAYEGMDAPQADVLACLTHVRSREWIEQMIHRITRYDRGSRLPWEHQFATIFAPKDKFFLDIMAKIKTEQAPYVEDREERPPPPPRKTKTHARESELTDRYAETFTDDEKSVQPDEHEQLSEAMKATGIMGAISITSAQSFLEVMQAQKQQAQSAEPQQAADVEPPTKREKKLRDLINGYQCEGYNPNDSRLKDRPKRRGQAIWQMFRKRVDDMTEAELQAVLQARTHWMVQ